MRKTFFFISLLVSSSSWACGPYDYSCQAYRTQQQAQQWQAQVQQQIQYDQLRSDQWYRDVRQSAGPNPPLYQPYGTPQRSPYRPF